MTNEYGIDTEALSKFAQEMTERFAEATDTQKAGPAQVDTIRRLGRDIEDASYILAYAITVNKLLMRMQGQLAERLHASALIFGTPEAAEDEFGFVSSIGTHHLNLDPNPFANDLPNWVSQELPF